MLIERPKIPLMRKDRSREGRHDDEGRIRGPPQNSAIYLYPLSLSFKSYTS